MQQTFKTVPNQRTITVSKQPTNKDNKYTCNNLEALGEAAKRLQSKGGFKLYMYLAKNQDKYNFALSSSDFCAWSGLGIAAYNTAFNELVNEGFLILNGTKNNYIFYDKPQKEDTNNHDNINISVPKEKVEEIRKVKETIDSGFSF